MGMCLPYSSTMAAEDERRPRAPRRSAEVLVDAIRRDCCRAQIITRKAFENAIAVMMAIGGSTNAVLHLLAIAHAAEVPLAIDDFEAIRATRSGAVRSQALGPLSSRPTCTAPAAFRR